MPRYARTQSLEHPIGAGGRLSVKVTSADVRLRGVDGDRATLHARFEISAATEEEADAAFERARLRASLGAKELSVEEPGGQSSLGGVIGRILTGRGSIDLSIEAQLPRGAEVRLETITGDVTGEGLHGEQRYATTSGDLYLDEAGGSLRIETVSGDVVIRAERPVSARVQAVSGDLALAAPRIDALRVQTVSGDVEVEGELGHTGEFRVETVSGDFSAGPIGSATFEVRGISTDISSDLDHRIEGRLDRRRLIIGTGQPTVVFSSMSGDLSVRRPRRVTAEAPVPDATPAPPELDEEAQMAILQALERGEIGVEEATRRLGGGRPDA